MRKLNDAIDRFCALHPNLAIPGLMRYIVGANAVLFVLSLFAGYGTLNFLALDISRVLHGEIWRLVTYVLLPTGSDFLLLISLLFYYWLGESLERMWGSTKFTFYYVSGTLLTAVGALAAYLIDGMAFPIWGASYVNMAMFFAYALSFPDAMVNLYFIIPVKMKWLAILDAVYFAAGVFQYASHGFWGMALMPVIAILNFFIFFSPDFHRRAEQTVYRARPEAVQFRKAVREQKKQKGYHHKCSVCGRTDTEYPDLQFRYCSKCTGYHCFCEDHIFNHTHFTD
ncbi:MAG: rhomboid family intramembrane serine protease [Oscillospiraceae bacterium]|nr:rhomboid family intramembrane serine protease [Oscillospiraceae bacterium]